MMLIATAWFLFYVKQENVADFAQWKSLLYALFTCVGVGACCFLQDYLAVRGLAVLLLLGAKLVVDTARPVESYWRLVLVTWAYLWVVTGIWLTISPWRLRDWITWATANDGRFRTVCAACTAFCLALAIIGLTAIRSAEQRPLALAPVTVCPSGMCVVANS